MDWDIFIALETLKGFLDGHVADVRRFAYLEDSEYSRVDWERGILQSCSQFQDEKKYLASASPESEPSAGSL